MVSLRGAVLKHYNETEVVEEEITTQLRYRAVLVETFGLAGDLADQLWHTVQERHQQWKQQQ